MTFAMKPSLTLSSQRPRTGPVLEPGQAVPYESRSTWEMAAGVRPLADHNRRYARVSEGHLEGAA